MAITFLEKRKKQKYLILVLTVVLLITAFVIWRGFFREPALPPPEPEEILKPPLKVEIDFEVLKSLFLKEFQPFEEISPWQEEIGRENPFTPY